jgi:hypothetical protein
MTGIPAKASFTGGSVTQGQFKTTLDQLIDALDERLVNGATPIQADTINEASVGAGVTVDGLLVKDGGVALATGKVIAPDDGGTGLEAVLIASDYGQNLQVNSAGDAFELIGPVHGFRNRLINGDFSIWQRGVSFSGANQYVSDHWRVGTASMPTSVTTSRQAFTPGQTDVPGEPEFFLRIDHADNNALLYQPVEDVRTLAGRNAVYSFYSKADTSLTMNVHVVQNFGSGGSTTVAVTSAALSLTTSWQRFEVAVTLPDLGGKTFGSGHHISFTHSTVGDYVLDFACMQLEEGTVATPFEQRPIATELALCQRYYAALDKASSAWAISSTTVAFSHEWPVEMRVAPTMAIIDTTFSFNDFNSGPVSVSPVLGTWAFTTKGGQSQATGFTGLFQSRPGFINQTTPVWSVDAEI